MNTRELIQKMTERAKKLIPICTTLEDLESRLAYEFELTDEEVKEIYMPSILETI